MEKLRDLLETGCCKIIEIIQIVFRAVFGDRVMEKAGKDFMTYFGSEDCPLEVCQDAGLRIIYCYARFERAESFEEVLGTYRAYVYACTSKEEADENALK